MKFMWKAEGYDPRELEVIADDTLWETGLYPVGPLTGGTRNDSSRIWPSFVPFTPAEIVEFQRSQSSTAEMMGGLNLVSGV